MLFLTLGSFVTDRVLKWWDPTAKVDNLNYFSFDHSDVKMNRHKSVKSFLKPFPYETEWKEIKGTSVLTSSALNSLLM